MAKSITTNVPSIQAQAERAATMLDTAPEHDWRKPTCSPDCADCKAQRDKDLDVCPTPQALANAAVWRLEEPCELRKKSTILEPSAGEGAFVRAAKQWSDDAAHVTAFEVRPECGEPLALAGADDVGIIDLTTIFEVSKKWPGKFATELAIINQADLVLGNPPFAVAEEHIRGLLAHMHDGAWLVFLLRVGFWGSKQRIDFWTQYPERYSMIIAPRPSFKLNKQGKAGTDSQEYAFFFWQKGWRGVPQRLPHLLWDKNKERREKKLAGKKAAKELAQAATIEAEAVVVSTEPDVEGGIEL